MVRFFSVVLVLSVICGFMLGIRIIGFLKVLVVVVGILIGGFLCVVIVVRFFGVVSIWWFIGGCI